jgi:hypothetical protein
MFTNHGRIHEFLPLTEPFHAEEVPVRAMMHPLLIHFMSKKGILLSFFGSFFKVILILGLLIFWVLLRDFRWYCDFFIWILKFFLNYF